MTWLLLLFAGGCAISDLKKRRIPNGMILSGGWVFLMIWFGLGIKIGYVDGWGRLEPGVAAAILLGLCEVVKCLLRAGMLLIMLFPLYLFRMMGAGDIKMAVVLFGAAGMRQGGRILLCGLAAAGVWSLGLLVWRRLLEVRLRYLAFYLCRFLFGGGIEPYYLEERDGKEASFCMAPFLLLGVMGSELIRHL